MFQTAPRRTTLALILGSFACGAFAPSIHAEDYPLGVILSLTGPGSVDSKEDLAGVQLAVDEINAAGGLLGQHPIRLTVKDDQGKPNAVSLTHPPWNLHKICIDNAMRGGRRLSWLLLFVPMWQPLNMRRFASSTTFRRGISANGLPVHAKRCSVC